MKRALAIYAAVGGTIVGACASTPSATPPPPRGEEPTTAIVQPPMPDPTPAAIRAPAPQVPACGAPVDSIGNQSRAGKRNCLIDKGCDGAAAPPALPRCDDGARAEAVPIARVAGLPEGTRVTVRGALGVGENTRCTMRGCRDACCNRCSRPLQLEDKSGATCATALLDADFACTGDESLVCCGGYPVGKTVIAAGKLGPVGGPTSISTESVCLE